MKKIMFALAAVACLSAPALADEDGSGHGGYGPYAGPSGFIGRHDDCGHGYRGYDRHSDRGYDRYSEREDGDRSFHDRRFERDVYDR